eukprot:jgi/Ulvmu1/5351/UM022_0145.1
MNDAQKLIHNAVDLKDAVERHSRNVDSDDYKLREEVYNKDHGELDEEFSKERPSRDTIAKLLDTRDRMARAGLAVTAEERNWREEVDAAVEQAQAAHAH